MKRFTRVYPLSKTLRFELKPIGKTLEFIQNNGLLKQDQHRAESYVKVKKIIDDYHKAFISSVLDDFRLNYTDEGKKNSLEEFYLYYIYLRYFYHILVFHRYQARGYHFHLLRNI